MRANMNRMATFESDCGSYSNNLLDYSAKPDFQSHHSQQTFVLNVDTRDDISDVNTENENDGDTPDFDGGSIIKTFSSVAFEGMADKLDITIRYDSNAELLSLKLVNTTTKNVFSEDFDKESIHKITDECKLEPDLVVKMIIDTLSAPPLTAKNMRTFLLPNLKKATAKYDEIVQVKSVPAAVRIESGAEKSDTDCCLLLILHFSAPPYISFNYGFIIKKIYISDNDKLAMRLADAEAENATLKEQVARLAASQLAQQQQIDALARRLDDSLSAARPVHAHGAHGAHGVHGLHRECSPRFNTVDQSHHQAPSVAMGAEHGARWEHPDVLNEMGLGLRESMVNGVGMMGMGMAYAGDAVSVEEIELFLVGGWSLYSGNWSVPKAVKIGHVVWLSGLVKGGSSGHIATLPPSWRPHKQKMFAQCTNGNTVRVDVFPDGRIFQQTKFKSFLSLEGISFVLQ